MAHFRLVEVLVFVQVSGKVHELLSVKVAIVVFIKLHHYSVFEKVLEVTACPKCFEAGGVGDSNK